MSVQYIPTNLKRLREAAGFTQRTLAAAVDTDAVSVSRWERGAVTPDTRQLIAVAKALGCKLDDIVSPPKKS